MPVLQKICLPTSCLTWPERSSLPLPPFVMLFLFDWKMGLLCLLTMVLALLSMCLMMGGKNAGFFHRYQKEIERMSGEAVEYVRGIPVVKMFQQTVYSFKAFYARHQRLQRPGQPVRHELPCGADLFPDFYQRSFRPADPGGSAAGLRRGRARRCWSTLSSMPCSLLPAAR